jgi:hypothetical protein
MRRPGAGVRIASRAPLTAAGEALRQHHGNLNADFAGAGLAFPSGFGT